MEYSINIKQWAALSAGLDSEQAWQNWSQQPTHDWSLTIPKSQRIPMMAARRMSIPSRLAVDVGLQLLSAQPEAAIFISRHGELERTYKILASLNQQTDVSPTDFAMSVHNTAAGLLTITAKAPLPLTSLSAGIDGFQQGLIEAQAMFANGIERILLIDFDGAIPTIYQSQVSSIVPAYAVGMIITKGTQWQCSATPLQVSGYHDELPQSLAFLHANLSQQTHFTIKGIHQDWQWQR